MVISLGTGTDDLLEAIDATGVEYKKTIPRPGQIMASAGDILTFAQDHATWGAIAAVLIAWIRARSTRQITITQAPNYKVIQAKGMGVEELEQLLGSTARVTVFDTAKPAKLKLHTEVPE
jgi:hypothetical protein